MMAAQTRSGMRWHGTDFQSDGYGLFHGFAGKMRARLSGHFNAAFKVTTNPGPLSVPQGNRSGIEELHLQPPSADAQLRECQRSPNYRLVGGCAGVAV